ncbi:MAG: A/G-specific adenine glycosylase [Phycisphaerales bacterium]
MSPPSRRPPASPPRRAKTQDRTRDLRTVRLLSAWFLTHQRPLPWRATDPARGTGYRDPYRSLVSEFMLQQTQVSRVLEKFEPFLRRFPTVHHLAAAHQDDVLAAWTGLGYYRRAKLLHAAAKAITERHAGNVPETTEQLAALPGVGRYTAGAIASMAHGRAEPLVDTNVVRVILRLEGRDIAPAQALPWVWKRAETLALLAHRTPATSAGIFNEALMELGATLCNRQPSCGQCPLADLCRARAIGRQLQIPRPTPKKARTPIVHATLLVRGPKSSTLLEQRPAKGLWAGLWQPPTLECPADKAPRTAAALARKLGLTVTRTTRADDFTFHTTHREVRFVCWHAAVTRALPTPARRWVQQADLPALAMSSPVRRLLGLS